MKKARFTETTKAFFKKKFGHDAGPETFRMETFRGNARIFAKKFMQDCKNAEEVGSEAYKFFVNLHKFNKGDAAELTNAVLREYKFLMGPKELDMSLPLRERYRKFFKDNKYDWRLFETAQTYFIQHPNSREAEQAAYKNKLRSVKKSKRGLISHAPSEGVKSARSFSNIIVRLYRLFEKDPGMVLWRERAKAKQG